MQENTQSRRAWTLDRWRHQAQSRLKSVRWISWAGDCLAFRNCSLHSQGLRKEEGVRERRENGEGILSRSLVVKGSRGVGPKREATAGS